MPMLLRHQIKAIRLDYEAYHREAKELALGFIERGLTVPTHTIHELLSSAAKDKYIASMLQEWEEAIP